MEGEIQQLLYFVTSRLQQESEQYQLAMFKHAIGDDGLKALKHSVNELMS
jgi:hypothetical protein